MTGNLLGRNAVDGPEHDAQGGLAQEDHLRLPERACRVDHVRTCSTHMVTFRRSQPRGPVR
jgi:hypothetical protein